MTERLERALHSDDPEERRVAASALQPGIRGAAALVLSALGDEDWRVREEGIRAAERLAPHPEVLRVLIEAIATGDNVGLHNATVEALGAFGESAVDALGMALPSMDADGRKLAIEALANTEHQAALFVLRTHLRDTDANVRAAAIEAITALGSVAGDEAVALLSTCLAADDPFSKLAALNGLNQLGASVPWRAVAPLLSDPVLRRAALEAAGRCGAREAAEPILEHLTQASGAELDASLRAAVSLLDGGGAGASEMTRLLRDTSGAVRTRLLEMARHESDSDEQRHAAVSLLGPLGGDDAAMVAIELLGDERMLDEAAASLEALGVDAIGPLTTAMLPGSEYDRASVIELLGRVLLNSPLASRGPAIDALVTILAEDSSDIRLATLEVLGDVGDARVVPDIADQLSDDGDPAVTRVAEFALRRIGDRHPAEARAYMKGNEGTLAGVVLRGVRDELSAAERDEDVAVLSAALSNESALVREAALESLAAVADPRAVDAIAFAVTDEVPEVRLAAVRALGRLPLVAGRSPGAPHLLSLLRRGRDPELLAAVVIALGEAGDSGTHAELQALLASEDTRVAVAAVEASARLGGGERLQTLRLALTNGSGEVVKAGLRVLGVEREATVLPLVSNLLEHPTRDVRRLAADVLGQWGSEAEVERLRARLEHEDEPLVREALQRALEALGALRKTPMPPKPGSYRPR